jgi:hypothetical protein
MRLFAFGSNGSGQLGIGHEEDVPTPTQCLFAQTETSLFFLGFYVWGIIEFDEVCDSYTSIPSMPACPALESQEKQKKRIMRLFAFGSNGSGQLGIGHEEDVPTPSSWPMPSWPDPFEPKAKSLIILFFCFSWDFMFGDVPTPTQCLFAQTETSQGPQMTTIQSTSLADESGVVRRRVWFPPAAILVTPDSSARLVL